MMLLKIAANTYGNRGTESNNSGRNSASIIDAKGLHSASVPINSEYMITNDTDQPLKVDINTKKPINIDDLENVRDRRGEFMGKNDEFTNSCDDIKRNMSSNSAESNSPTREAPPATHTRTTSTKQQETTSEEELSDGLAQILGPIPIDIPDVVTLTSSTGSTPTSSSSPISNVLLTAGTSPRCVGTSGVKPNGIYSPSRCLNPTSQVDRIDEDDTALEDEDSSKLNTNNYKCFVPIGNVNNNVNNKLSKNSEENYELVENDDNITSAENCKRVIHLDPPISTAFDENENSVGPKVFRDRRQTINSKFPTRKHGRYINKGEEHPRKSSLADDHWWQRKTSVNSSLMTPNEQRVNDDGALNDDDDDLPCQPRQLTGYRRRMSVPEKSLFNANYAILRKNFESEIEIVGAFQKSDSDAYRNYLDSLTCYDLAPHHGVVIMLDAKLTLHKAVTILCLNAGNRVALVNNVENRQDNTGIFTVTDCLHVLQEAVTQAKSNNGTLNGADNLAEKNLQYFLDEIQQKHSTISATSNTSVWNVARLFRMNRVHRIPIIAENISVSIQNGALQTTKTVEVISFISLKTIFIEILKLCDSKCTLKPNLHLLTVKAIQLGEWSQIATISEEDTFAKAIETLLERKFSCLPILRSNSRTFVGVLTKNDILDAVAQCGPENYVEVLETPIKAIIKEDGNNGIYVTPDTTIEKVIRLILNNSKKHAAAISQCQQEQQCIYIVDEEKSMALIGVVSLADIMQYIFNSTNLNSQQQQASNSSSLDENEN